MAEGEAPDRVEIWAKRFGRTLGYIAVAALALCIMATYLSA